MKKTMKISTILLSALLAFAACNQVPEGKVIGTIDGKEIAMAYYDKIFPADEPATETNPIEEQGKDKEEQDKQEEDKKKREENAVLDTILTPVLEKYSDATVDRQALNAAINNIKGRYGDKYLEEAEKIFQTPIETEQDLVRTISSTLLRNDFLKRQIPVTDEKISEIYYDKHKTIYEADHILVKDEAGAQTLLDKILSGQKNFSDYLAEAQQILTKKAEENGGQRPQQLQLNDETISDVKVDQIADLGSAPASKYVAPFGEALKQMQPGETSSTLVKTEFGYHIIRLRDTEENELTKELQTEIKDTYVSEQLAQTGRTAYYIKNVIDKATIDITDERAKKAWDAYVNKQTEEAVKYNPEAGQNEQTEAAA